MWLNERMTNPKPKEELKVLGFQGANALAQARYNMQNHIYNLKIAPRAGKAQHPLGNHALPADFTGLTPEQLAAGKRAIGQRGLISPEHLLEAAGMRPAGELANMIEHPIRSYQEHQARVKAQAADWKLRGIKPAMSIGIVPGAGGGEGGMIGKGLSDAMRTKLESATVELAWTPGAKLETIAKKYSLHPDALAQFAQEHGPRLTGRILSNDRPGLAQPARHDSPEVHNLLQDVIRPGPENPHSSPLAQGFMQSLREGTPNLEATPPEPPKPPPPPPEEPPAPPAPGGGESSNPADYVAAQKIQQGLGASRKATAEQAQVYRVTRAARFSRFEDQLAAGGGSKEAFVNALSELKGELPKVTFDRWSKGEITDQDIEALLRQTANHPELQSGQKAQIFKGLMRATQEGRALTKSQNKLFQDVFGPDVAKAFNNVSLRVRAGETFLSALNIPRSLMASFDVSAPFRQGLVAGVNHPSIFFKAFPTMFKALKSEDFYNALIDSIHRDPNYELFIDNGGKFTELGRIGKREEQFQSDLAEKIPGIGIGVRASGRAYTGFLDKIRMDVFNYMLEEGRNMGHNMEDPKMLRGLTHYINAATGRGSLGKFESWAPAMNALFFSPRLIASRVNLLFDPFNPMWWERTPPFVRRTQLKAMMNLVGMASMVMTLAVMGGAKVVYDPRNADFGKLRLGNTRVDILGGFQQYVRFMAQISPSWMGGGKVISSTTGRTMTLGPNFGKMNRFDIAWRFISGKFTPTASLANDIFHGTNYAGQPLSWKKEALQRIFPLVAQDAYDLYHQGSSNWYAPGSPGSLGKAALGYGVSAFGIGMQTYGPATGISQSAKGRIKQFTKDFTKYIGKGIPPNVIKEANIDALLNHQIYLTKDSKGQIDYGQALQYVLDAYEKVHGFRPDVSDVHTQAEAHARYNAYRYSLTAQYHGYQNVIDARKSAERGRQKIKSG